MMMALDLIVQKVEELEGRPVQVGERDTNIVRYRIAELVGVKLYRGESKVPTEPSARLRKMDQRGRVEK